MSSAALWHNKLKTLIATREVALEKYQQHLAAYPRGQGKYERFLEAVQNTFAAVIGSIQKLESRLEQQSRKAALVRLDMMLRTRPPSSPA